MEDFLRLVELFPHELFKVIVENEVLKLGKLLRHNLLLDFIHDVVSLIVLEVALHEHFLFKLA